MGLGLGRRCGNLAQEVRRRRRPPSDSQPRRSNCTYDMGKWKRFVIPVLASTFLFLFPCVCSASPLLGVHPLDTAYFSADVIGCKDGSKAFTRDRLNDNFCDCFDGTDEPGTSACPAAKFYCSNAGSAPQFIYSSHVNDHFCDCCDGSDEYDSGVRCPNTCIMGGSVRHNVESHKSTGSKQHQNDVKERSSSVTLQDLMQKLEGLKMLAVLEGLLVCFLVVLWICHRHPRSRRRRAR